MASFCNKYFLEGPQFEEGKRAREGKHRWRRVVGLVLPAALVHFIWWPAMAMDGSWDMFVEKEGGTGPPRWYLAVTMMFGSLLAGATSEGGAAVAFPVMTLALGIPPPVARDFGFMIQSVGMVAASFVIVYTGVRVEWRGILFTTVGGVVGVVLYLQFVRLPPAFSKMCFVCTFGAFAVSLSWLNRHPSRKTFYLISEWNEQAPIVNRKSIALVFTGVVGGLLTGMSGSGLDIFSFAILTLLFRVSEKTATPTSVVLMGINSAVAFFYRQVVMGGVHHEAWGYFFVCIPIVVVGAPLGSVIGSYFHRLTLAYLVCILDFVQFVGALIVVRPWLHTNQGGATDAPALLCLVSVCVLFGCAFLFSALAKKGRRFVETPPPTTTAELTII
jgi:uncharacterized membrane protein YfcA